MCLAIFQPVGVSIPEGHLAEGFRSNSDGAGFMYFDDAGELCTFRSMSFDKFIDEYETQWALHGQDSPFSIHFRWATHGSRNVSNCHPYRLGENVAVLHNGIIDCIINDTSMSDTAAFVRDYLGSLPRNWYDNEFLFDMVENFTSGSKLVVMTSDPDSQYSTYIINERLGHWDGGIWYSNASYSCPKPGLFATYSHAARSAKVFENEDDVVIDACHLCGEESVLDDVCYSCESCQLCFETEANCKCDPVEQLSFHDMTTSQYLRHFNV